jgi:hypothetical protein
VGGLDISVHSKSVMYGRTRRPVHGLHTHDYRVGNTSYVVIAVVWEQILTLTKNCRNRRNAVIADKCPTKLIVLYFRPFPSP